MKYGYKEVRKIEGHEIRKLCIKNGWFTNGTNAKYDELVNYENCELITTDELVEMALLIKLHSETEYPITSIMYELAKICYTYFEEVE